MNGTINATSDAMIETIKMDSSGRLVLPKPLREQLHLKGGASLRAEIVAGRLELTPVNECDTLPVTVKGGVKVISRTGRAADAAAAVAAERHESEGRGRKR
jgi:bifunctional DNA-binding transcriptional regulator/antitoxin component of YhaV-PrlF toxin-antitoxin module